MDHLRLAHRSNHIRRESLAKSLAPAFTMRVPVQVFTGIQFMDQRREDPQDHVGPREQYRRDRSYARILHAECGTRLRRILHQQCPPEPTRVAGILVVAKVQFHADPELHRPTCPGSSVVVGVLLSHLVRLDWGEGRAVGAGWGIVSRCRAHLVGRESRLLRCTDVLRVPSSPRRDSHRRPHRDSRHQPLGGV